MAPAVREAAARLGEDPLDLALYGGEDLALLYAVAPEDGGRAPGHVLGELTAAPALLLDGDPLTGEGFDPFPP